MKFRGFSVGITFIISSAFVTNVFAFDARKLHECAKKKAVLYGYQVSGVEKYEEGYFDILLDIDPISKVRIGDLVAADEARNGAMYDRLVSMRKEIKLCSKFNGRLDISDFDGGAIAKDRF